ncbi:hypothetical protein D3H35_09295 [Cohnella faecalis]|uniref:RHS repeat-associated core domain-containing protein n=2 Tax=Cohnella faecalis TaxID=2315694 RepID=A0A398CN67_9BACL|nr:hypothetical protein D3H35_09295 [Cohnella faecalis]
MSNPFKYTGEIQDDESGLIYLRVSIMILLLVDLLMRKRMRGIDDPLTLNLYTYVGDNPFIYTDPSGHKWKLARDVWNFVSGSASKSYQYVKDQHTSWEKGLSYWTLGMSDPFFASAKNSIVLTNNPNGATGFYAKAVEFLVNQGYKFIKNGDYWSAVKK